MVLFGQVKIGKSLNKEDFFNSFVARKYRNRQCVAGDLMALETCMYVLWVCWLLLCLLCFCSVVHKWSVHN